MQAETNLEALKARDRQLAQTEVQLQAKLNRFPSLLAEYNRSKILARLQIVLAYTIFLNEYYRCKPFGRCR
ncbi:MAG: hypothetical protein SAJ37_08985 [Oscillatoria sp. PMC 1068.18]|nr:hypothetical protein [Oscillatoria sp. PMC 1076.18]MEC4988868.1 hypothetical protein [Oscillatoria sp. PMC 1068.18]